MEFLLPLIGLGIIAALLPKGSGSGKSEGNCYARFNDVRAIGNVPFAKGSCFAIWPVITNHSRKYEVPYRTIQGSYVNGNPARAFGYPRSDGERLHVGIDLYCNDQDVCVACEDGKIIDIRGFLNVTKAILLETNSGILCLYGEVEDDSWDDFGIKRGSIVKKGQPLCRIGKNINGTQMLHFETYKKGTTKNYPWYTDQGPPQQILNPTKYLLNIATKYENKKS